MESVQQAAGSAHAHRKCQTSARDRWLGERQRELPPVGYYHLVFSVPYALVPLM
jgi:hypothetical protein